MKKKVVSSGGGSLICLLSSRYLDHSAFGALVDVVVAGFSLVFAAAYIANTYIPSNEVGRDNPIMFFFIL